MPQQNPKDTRIKVYCLLKENSLIDRVNRLASDHFDIIMLEDLRAALVCDHENCVLIIEREVYPDIKHQLNSDHSGIIVVSDKNLSLKDEVINKVPKELFLTDYLDEFIYWTVEKSRYIKEIHMKKKLKSKKIETLIDELHELSHRSVLKKDGIRN